MPLTTEPLDESSSSLRCPAPSEDELAGLAQDLFAAYNDQGPNPWKTWDGKDVPRWPELSDQVREKWRAVARRALERLAPTR